MIVAGRRGDAARAGIAGDTGRLAPRLLRRRAPPACGASDGGEPGTDISHACRPVPPFVAATPPSSRRTLRTVCRLSVPAGPALSAHYLKAPLI